MRRGFLFILGFSFLCVYFSVHAQRNIDLQKSVFAKLNLSLPGLDKVKKEVQKHNYAEASEALLNYFRNRKGVKLPKYNKSDQAKYKGKKLSLSTRRKADSALKHVFFVHEGYGYNGDGYLHYGKDINWQYWPVKDNEIRWQVNRMYWWIPLGLVYWSTGDEKYAKEWIDEYKDWIKKNPLGKSNDIDRFSWRALEVSDRLQDQTALFNFFINSRHFTPDFLMIFLANYYKHADYLIENFSDRGNHLLFEGQRIIYAGSFFPEFKDAKYWRKEGIKILNNGLGKQVYSDGLQYELSPNYHVASINIFIKGLRMAKINGYGQEFPESYYLAIEKMIKAVVNFSYPDYTYPMFSDAKLVTKQNMIENYKKWAKLFPEDKVIEYFATEGKKGDKPPYLSKGLTKGGIYTFRNSWLDTATVMVLKASPPAFWHSQPDNGTFDLWVRGRNFMPDAGSYVYGGSKEVLKARNWYRQTKVHQTLTLNNKNMSVCDAKLIKWSTSDSLDVLSYVNPSYDNLNHKRTVFFVENKFFVIVDEAMGTAKGELELHYQLAPNSNVVWSPKKMLVYTRFNDNNNLIVKCFSKDPLNLVEEIGKVSYSYREFEKRPAFAFEKRKDSDDTETFITVIYPYVGESPPRVGLHCGKSNDLDEGNISLVINVNGEKYNIATKL